MDRQRLLRITAKTFDIFLILFFNLIKKADYANPKRVNIINRFENEVKIEVGKILPYR